MCGIAGFVGNGTIDDLRRMNTAQTSRGPDAAGEYCEENNGVYLGHRRLSIIDLDGGVQPMWSADGKVGIVFNGEIYNHAELREELKSQGAIFITDHSDTEVLLQGYRLWGDDFVSRLNGMWAFVIYDRSNRRLFMSRDRFGKKPFYYVERNGLFAFASELSALIAHSAISGNTTVSALAIHKYFAYGYIPAPHSLYEGIYKLPAGFNAAYDLGIKKLKVWQYWDFVIEPFDTIPANPELEWGERLRELLNKAVQRRLISDVPIGVFLSGGIDSSAVAAYAAKALGVGALNTFSIGFNEQSFDESAFAELAAKHIQSRHHAKTLSVATACTLIPQILARLDEPMGDSSIIPTYLLCGYAREHCTVALGGDGADELFAGYDPFKALKWAELYNSIIPKPVHQAIRLLAAKMPVSHRNMSLDFKIKRTLRGLSYPQPLWTSVWMATIAPDEWQDCLHAPIALEETYSEAIASWDNCQQANVVDKTLQFYTKLYLQDDILTKVDRTSMMHSLEVRAPFLDIDLVDFVRKIPHQYKIRQGQTKYILKKALEPILPNEILYRPKKGFGVPIGAWFKTGQLNFAQQVLHPQINKYFLTSKIQNHKLGKSDERAFLWNAYVLNFFDNLKA
jgi:asparagine synthase (glutamine-hydrolysing)